MSATDAVQAGLNTCSTGVAYGDRSVGEDAAMAAYATLRCCNLITAGDWRVPERIGRLTQEISDRHAVSEKLDRAMLTRMAEDYALGLEARGSEAEARLMRALAKIVASHPVETALADSVFHGGVGAVP